MPPETQVGANTFGVTINGRVYVPRTPTGTGIGGSNGQAMELWRASNFSWYELEIKDGKSPAGFNMKIHIDHLAGVGSILLKQSDFHDQYDSGLFTHIYFKVWDSNISNYAYYGSVDNQGEINVTRLDSGIFSANFKGKFIRYDNPNEFIQITDGRFDINAFTLPNAVFP
ncbi:MAG: hypothetical protein H7221_10995 [Flavobacterium sp.]|nr:hypothetical protein [Flavobacterium sp.]